MFYFTKTAWWLKRIYSGCIWEMPVTEKKLYLSFDDGPHPVITPFVLDELKKYNAKAVFFCIGKNVKAYPEVYKRIIDEGHAVGNHTFNHMNGWKTRDELYLDDIAAAKQYIDSNMFRPPYGRIGRFQLKQLDKPRFKLRTIMWTVLSGDFDKNISAERCLNNVVLNTTPGAIIVFHDSEKAETRMKYALPRVLQHFTDQGFQFDRLAV